MHYFYLKKNIVFVFEVFYSMPLLIFFFLFNKSNDLFIYFLGDNFKIFMTNFKFNFFLYKIWFYLNGCDIKPDNRNQLYITNTHFYIQLLLQFSI